MTNSPPRNEWVTKRAVALTLAVLHHGFSCFSSAPNSVPSSAQTVTRTADTFKDYLDGKSPPR